MASKAWRGPGWFEYWYNVNYNPPPENVRTNTHPNFKDVKVAKVGAPRSFKNSSKPSK